MFILIFKLWSKKIFKTRELEYVQLIMARSHDQNLLIVWKVLWIDFYVDSLHISTSWTWIDLIETEINLLSLAEHVCAFFHNFFAL